MYVITYNNYIDIHCGLSNLILLGSYYEYQLKTACL